MTTFIARPGNNLYVGDPANPPNIIDYSAAPSAIVFNFASGSAANGFGGADTFANIQNVVGSSARGNLFVSASGNHTIEGGVGTDNNVYNFRSAPGPVTVNLHAGVIRTAHQNEFLLS